ncbi:MAG: MFS transporter [Armatimonadetes bacterium]|nr:MFS transporter [Armatimonadota bacterium]
MVTSDQRRDTASTARAKALVAAVLAAGAVTVAIVVGSGWFRRFDPALAAYASATVFAAFAIAYRFVMWVQRPPTWHYFTAGLRLFFRPDRLAANLVRLVVLFWNDIVAQTFIEKRSTKRWLAHMSLAWGCLLAFAITFPLSWGWIQFGVAANGHDYVVEFMGLPTIAFPPDSFLAFLFFNGLNISAVMVLVGVGLAMHRRVFESGARAVQTLANDFMPLFLLFSVAVTGLMLTASYRLMGGSHFSFISLLHAFTVIVFLLWLPFGKFFHVIQRPAQIGVAYYKTEGAEGPQAACARSGQEYQSLLHHDDLVNVMRQVGQDFGPHQDLSPQEKRKLVALNQAALIDGVPFVG